MTARLLCLACLLITLPLHGQEKPPPEPSLILHNGTVLTVDKGDRIAQALAIHDGRILAVGDEREILALAGASTEFIDLKGATATPGLIDTHAHFSTGGVLKLTQEELAFPGVQRIQDIVDLLTLRKAITAPGDWLLGRGWDEGKLEEKRYVTATDIDAATGDSPTWLMHTMGHYGTASSEALRRAGITRDTPDPPGGVIVRDENGEPNGVLKERAMGLVSELIPGPRREQKLEAIRLMAREFNSEGMTAVKDPGIGYALSYDLESARRTWDLYREVDQAGDLSVRVFALWRAAETPEQARELIDFLRPFTRPWDRQISDRLVSGGVKLFADGSGGARTAWTWHDWNKNRTGVDEGNRGYPAIDADLLRELILQYHQARLHMGIHAIGDRAIDWTVASLTTALIQQPIIGLRHSIIHANIPTDLSLNTLARLQQEYEAGYPETTAGFTWWIGDTYAGNFGVERSKRLNPYKSYKQRGIQWAGGSDFPVTPFPARYGLWASVAREPLLGTWGKDAFGSEQSVDLRSALLSYTRWAAWQLFMEDRIGSLEPGKYADIAVWDVNPYSAKPLEVKEMNCLLTLVEGEVVYRAE